MEYHTINLQTKEETHGSLQRRKGYDYQILHHTGHETKYTFYGRAARHLDHEGPTLKIFRDASISAEAKAEYAESIGTLGSSSWPWQQKMVFNTFVGYPVVPVEKRE